MRRSGRCSLQEMERRHICEALSLVCQKYSQAGCKGTVSLVPFMQEFGFYSTFHNKFCVCLNKEYLKGGGGVGARKGREVGRKKKSGLVLIYIKIY